MSKFNELRKLDVSAYTEKKGQLTYLSWVYAVDQLLQADPTATWEYKEPRNFGDTMMVFCAVTAFGKTMCAQLPVMDNRNKAIANPDAFQVNTAMQRCLAKAIALHGIGLYIYAGEDLPESEHAQPSKLTESQQADITAMAGEVGLTVKEICAKAKVSKLSDLASDRYDGLVRWLKSQREAA